MTRRQAEARQRAIQRSRLTSQWYKFSLGPYDVGVRFLGLGCWHVYYRCGGQPVAADSYSKTFAAASMTATQWLKHQQASAGG